VDENDNNQYDVGEPFIDVNQNQMYDGPNGKWDSDTVIWAETRILYTGPISSHTSGWTTSLAVRPPVAPGSPSFDLLTTDHPVSSRSTTITTCSSPSRATTPAPPTMAT